MFADQECLFAINDNTGQFGNFILCKIPVGSTNRIL